MTYLRARYYDSGIRRFISEDPIRDGLNWYSYAGNNPVMFVDPSGMELQIKNGADVYMNVLNTLSDDTLYTNTDEDGYVYVYILEKTSDPDECTMLVRRIIEDSKLCTLELMTASGTTEIMGASPFDENNASNLGVGSGGAIKLDPNYDVYVDTADGKQIMPFFISVAHEMIHILRYMGGYRKTEYISDNNARQEELETVGISFQDNNGNFIDANN